MPEPIHIHALQCTETHSKRWEYACNRYASTLSINNSEGRTALHSTGVINLTKPVIRGLIAALNETLELTNA